MTTLDLIVTSLFESKHMQTGYIVGPPKKQWFAIHPNMVLQYHEGAAKGDQFKLGTSLEWLGVNWWGESPIGIPFGASIMTVSSPPGRLRQRSTVRAEMPMTLHAAFKRAPDDCASAIAPRISSRSRRRCLRPRPGKCSPLFFLERGEPQPRQVLSPSARARARVGGSAWS